MSDPHEEASPPTHSSRQRRTKNRHYGWRNADVLRTAALVMGLYLACRLFWFARPLFLTAFLGILFGLAVGAGVDRLERFRIPRGLSAAIIVLGFFGLLAGFGAWMAPTLHEQGVELRKRLPESIDRMQSYIKSHPNGVVGMVFSNALPDQQSDSTPVKSATTPAAAPSPAAAAVKTAVPDSGADATALLRERLSTRMHGATRFVFPFLSSTVEVITGFLIIIFLSVYIAIDPGMYRAGIIHLFMHERRQRIGEVLSAIAAVLRKWLVTQLIAMVAMGVITTVILLVLRVKAAFALGLISGMLEFIPTAGALISAAPAIAMGFLDSPEKALYVTIAYVGVHFLEGHLLIPLLMKGGVDLPPALTIISQAIMALLFGFLGLMCAVPLLAATMVAVKMLYVEDIVGDRQIKPGEDSHKGIAPA